MNGTFYTAVFGWLFCGYKFELDSNNGDIIYSTPKGQGRLKALSVESDKLQSIVEEYNESVLTNEVHAIYNVSYEDQSDVIGKVFSFSKFPSIFIDNDMSNFLVFKEF